MSACPDPQQLPSVQARVSPAEWQLRVELAAAYRLVALHGWDDLIYSHISARVPGAEHHFLLNPFGLLFDEITASSLVKVDLDGNKVLDSPYGVSKGGFVLHATIHAARPDALCVLHTHTDHGIALAAQREGLRALSQHALFQRPSIAYFGYTGLLLSAADRERLVADLGSARHMVLRNHGLVSIGADPADAFLLMFDFERACRVQLLAQASGSALDEIDPAVQRTVWTQAFGAGEPGPSPDNALIWAALRRRLDRLDRSYRR